MANSKLPSKLFSAMNSAKSKTQLETAFKESKTAVQNHQEAAQMVQLLKDQRKEAYDRNFNAQAQNLRNANARNLPLEARQSYLNQFAGGQEWSSKLQIEQYKETNRKHQQQRASGALNQTRGIENPQQRMDARNQIMQDNRSVLGEKNRIMIDAQVANRRDASQIERRALIAQKTEDTAQKAQARQVEREAVQKRNNSLANMRNRADGHQMGRGLEIDAINNRQASPSAKIDMLNATKSGEFNGKILERIDKSINQQTAIIQKDKGRADSIRENSPILSRMFTGSMQGPQSLTQAQAVRLSNSISAVRAVGGGMIAGASAGFDMYNSAQQARNGSELRSFNLLAGIQAKNANMALAGFSGSDLFSRNADILGGNSNSSRLFLGQSGLARSQLEGTQTATRERDLKAQAALKDAIMGIAAGGAGIVGGLAVTGASFGGAAPIGLGVAGAGMAQIGSSISGLMNSTGVNSFLASKGLYTPSDKLATEGSAQLLARGREIADQSRASDLSRNQLSVSALDASLNYDVSQMSNMRSGVAYSSESELLAVGRKQQTLSRLRNGNIFGGGGSKDELAQLNDQFQSTVSAFSNSNVAGGQLGVDATTFDSMATASGLAMGPNYRGGGKGQVKTTVMAEELSRSGRGSFEQILGNLSTLNKVTGKADSSSELLRTMSKAVSLGFDNSKLTQEFIGRVADTASGAGLRDIDSTTNLMSRVAQMFGGGEIGLRAAEKGVRETPSFVQNNVRAKAFQNLGMNKAAASLKLTPGQLSEDVAIFADAFSGLDPLVQQEYLKNPSATQFVHIDNQLAGLTPEQKKAYLAEVDKATELASTGGIEVRPLLAKAEAEAKSGNMAASRKTMFGAAGRLLGLNNMTPEIATTTLQAIVNKGDFPALARVGQEDAISKKRTAAYTEKDRIGAAARAKDTAVIALGKSTTQETLLFDLMRAGAGTGEQSAAASIFKNKSTLGLNNTSKKLGGMIDSEAERLALDQVAGSDPDKRLAAAKKVKDVFGKDVTVAEIVDLSVKLKETNKQDAMVLSEQNRKEAFAGVGIQTVSITRESIAELALGIVGATKGNLPANNRTPSPFDPFVK